MVSCPNCVASIAVFASATLYQPTSSFAGTAEQRPQKHTQRAQAARAVVGEVSGDQRGLSERGAVQHRQAGGRLRQLLPAAPLGPGSLKTVRVQFNVDEVGIDAA